MLNFIWSEKPDEAMVVFIAGQLREIDARLRRDCAGMPVAELMVEIGPILDLIGVELVAGELSAYARSVSNNTDWVFDLSSYRFDD